MLQHLSNFKSGKKQGMLALTEETNTLELTAVKSTVDNKQSSNSERKNWIQLLTQKLTLYCI